MRILLAAPKDPMIPIGMAYISAALKEAGHAVDCRYHDGRAGLSQLLTAGDRYDFLATGGMSLHFNQLTEIISVARTCRTKVILGGNIVTSEPEFITKTLGVDFSVIGQGEETVVALLQCLERNEDPAGVPGIGFLKEGRFVLTERRKAAMDLDALPWPNYEGFGFRERLDAAKSSDRAPFWDVFDHPREYPLVAARSCPYSCTFCYHPKHEPYRQRSIESIMRELETVVPRYRINIISIMDDLLSEKEERVHALCKELRRLRESLSWDLRWSCQMRVSGATPEMLDDMQKSGCYLISYGFESYSPVVLQSMKKHTTPDQIHSAIHATLDKHISIQGGFIFGDIAETLETAQETLDFWRAHPEAGISLNFVMPYPDSALYRHCLEKGIITDKLHYIRRQLFETLNMTGMSDRDFGILQERVYRHNFRLPSVVPVERTSDSLSVRCPHCGSLTVYRNYASSLLIKREVLCRNCRKRILVRSRWLQLTDLPGAFHLRLFLAKYGVKIGRLIERWRLG